MSSLIAKLFLLRMLSTPYPWMVLVVAVAAFTLIMAILAYHRSVVLDMGFFVILTLVTCSILCSIDALDAPTDNPKLDNKSLNVICYTNRGIRISTGRVITPAGCEFLSVANPRHRNPKPAMEEFVGGGKVLLKWSDEMDGYQIFNDKNEDMAAYLVSRGLVRTKFLASEDLRSLEREARANKIGIWERAWKGAPEMYRGPDIFIIGSLSVVLIFLAAVAVVEYWGGLCLK